MTQNRINFSPYLFIRILIFLGLFTSFIFGQHDRERNAFRYLAEDKIEKAYHELKNGKKHTDPAEKGFISTLCLLHEGKVEQALDSARDAVRLGLPFERLLAEPREWLGPLREHTDFKKWKRTVSPNISMARGSCPAINSQTFSYSGTNPEHPPKATVNFDSSSGCG